MKIVGLLLAGGLSRRMGGGDKALRLIGGCFFAWQGDTCC